MMSQTESPKSAFVETGTLTRTVQTEIGPIRIEYRKRTRKVRGEALLVAMEHYKSMTGKDGYSVMVYQDECAKRMLQSWSLTQFTPQHGWALLDPDMDVADKLMFEMGIKNAEVTPDADAKNSQPGEAPTTLSSDSNSKTG